MKCGATHKKHQMGGDVGSQDTHPTCIEMGKKMLPLHTEPLINHILIYGELGPLA